MSETSLVSFVVKRYKKGDEENSEFLSNEVIFSFPLWENICKYTINELERTENPGFRYSEKDVIFEEDCYCFHEAQPFGQSFDSQWCSGIDYEIDYIGMEVFEGFEEQLTEIAKQLLKEHEEKIELFAKDNAPSNEVQFVTVWYYTSYHDTYWDEFDTEWDLLGVLDMQKVKGMF